MREQSGRRLIRESLQVAVDVCLAEVLAMLRMARVSVELGDRLFEALATGGG